MQKQIITALLFILIIDLSTSASSCRCKNFENNIYQFTTTITNQQPFYTIVTLLPNGMYYETSNIASGQNAAELGSDIPFNVHNGYYSCLPGNKVEFVSIGYIYKNANNPLLSTNGAIAVHYFDVQFLNNDSRQCTGLFSYALYTTGVNPFDSRNTPVFITRNHTVTCQLFNGRDFQLL